MACGDEVVLELFVHGQSAHSTAALGVIQKVCEEYFSAHFKLEVIDIYQQPERTRAARVMVAPTLIRRSPEPTRRVVGSLTEERLFTTLQIEHA